MTEETTIPSPDGFWKAWSFGGTIAVIALAGCVSTAALGILEFMLVWALIGYLSAAFVALFPIAITVRFVVLNMRKRHMEASFNRHAMVAWALWGLATILLYALWRLVNLIANAILD